MKDQHGHAAQDAKMSEHMGKPERIEETFETPEAAAHRLTQLTNEQRLAGAAMIHAAPAAANTEDSFPPQSMRGMLWGGLAGLIIGVLLGVWFERAMVFSGSWGGLLSGGVPALATLLGAFLGGVAALLGGLIGFSRSDPHGVQPRRARLSALVKPERTSQE